MAWTSMHFHLGQHFADQGSVAYSITRQRCCTDGVRMHTMGTNPNASFDASSSYCGTYQRSMLLGVHYLAPRPKASLDHTEQVRRHMLRRAPFFVNVGDAVLWQDSREAVSLLQFLVSC